MPPKPSFEAGAAREAYRAAHEWPLPPQPYLPGMTQRPDGTDDVHRVAAMAPKPTDPDRWRENAAYLAGFRLYQAGYGWEAHEVWEPVWMHAASHSAERYLLQGLIQLANARLKFTMSRGRAGERLQEIAAGLLEEASYAAKGQTVMGVDAGALMRDVLSVRDDGDHTIDMHYNA